MSVEGFSFLMIWDLSFMLTNILVRRWRNYIFLALYFYPQVGLVLLQNVTAFEYCKPEQGLYEVLPVFLITKSNNFYYKMEQIL